MKVSVSKKDVKIISAILIFFLVLYVTVFMYMGESIFSYDHFRNALISKNIAEGGEMTLIGAAYYKHTFLFFVILSLPYLFFKTFASQTYFMILISLITLSFNYFFFKNNFSRKIALFTTFSLGFYSLYLYYSLRIMHEVFILLAALVSISFFYQANKKDTLGAWAIAGIAAGFALLIRPPLGLMFPAVGLFMIILHFKDFKRFFIYLINTDFERFLANRFVNLFLSFFIALAIYAPWYYFTKVNGSTFSWMREFRMEYAWMQGRDPDSIMRFFTMFAESLGPSYAGYIFAGILTLFLVYGMVISLLRINKKHKYREYEILFLLFSLFIIGLQFAWPIKEFRFFFPLYPMFLYFVYVAIVDASKRFKNKIKVDEKIMFQSLVILVMAIFILSTVSFVLAKDYTTASNLKEVQIYAAQNGFLDKNWASDQRMSAAYYLDDNILHLVDINGQMVQIMSYNIDYVALKKETTLPEGFFIHVADVGEFKIYRVDKEIVRTAFSQGNQVVNGAVKLGGDIPGKRIHFSLGLQGPSGGQNLYTGTTNEDGSFELFVPQSQGAQIVATFYSWGYESQTVQLIPGQANQISLDKGSFFKHSVPVSGF